MPHFALTLVHARNWNQSRLIREQDRWGDHAAFMDELVDAGFIVVGGPIGSGDHTLHLVKATDDEEIRNRLSHDPWAKMELLEIGSIEPWALWLDGRNAPK